MTTLTESPQINTTPIRLGGLRAWFIWGIALTFLVFQFFIQLTSGEIITGLMHSFSVTAFGGGLIASAYYYIYVMLQIPAGMLMDRFRPRKLLTCGAFVLCLGAWGFATAKQPSLAFAARLVMGAGASFAFVGALYLLAQWFPLRRFAIMTAFMETIGMMGSVVCGVFLAQTIERFGWRQSMLGTAFIAGIIGFLLWAFVRNSPNPTHPTAELEQQTLMSGLKPLITSRIAWINGAYSGILFSILSVFIALWGIPFLQLEHHLSLTEAVLIANVTFLGTAAGTPLFGWLDSRTHCRKLILQVTPLITAGLLWIVILVPSLSLVTLAITLFLCGLISGSYVLTFVIANEIAEHNNRATSIGMTNFLSVGAAPVLQPLIGLILTLLNSGGQAAVYSVTQYQIALSVLPIALIIAAVLGGMLPSRKL